MDAGELMGKRILTIDGGGIKGIIPAFACAEIEAQSGKKMNELFDLMSGGSTGSILCAGLALGIPAQEMADLYVEHGSDMFVKRTKWFRPWEYITKPKYEKQPVIKRLEATFGDHTLMSDIRNTKFMAGVRDIVNSKYEFFTSWQDRYAYDRVVDVVLYSMSAVYYFGRTEDKKRHTFFSDGAMGIYNSSQLTAAIEASKLGWMDNGNEVSILSLGCGKYNTVNTYDEVKEWSMLTELFEVYVNKEIPSIADLKDAVIRYLLVDKVSNYVRINPDINYQMTEMDAVQNIPELVKIAKENAKKLRLEDILK